MPTVNLIRVLSLGVLGVLGSAWASEVALPLPTAASLPPEPPLCPSVATSAGKRLLLADTDATVTWDARAQLPRSNRPDWWLVNYPLSAIAADAKLPSDDLAHALTGHPLRDIRNWWLLIPGAATPEPATPHGPAPCVPTAGAALIVDGGNPAADDAGPATATQPLRTIAAAVKRLAPGMLIQVRPGIYRESVVLATAGTAEQPIILEGIRDAAGALPVISGNDVVPSIGWQAEPGHSGIYRSPLPSDLYGTVSYDGVLARECDLVATLQPGEVVVNRSSREFAMPRLRGDERPTAGMAQDGQHWQTITANADGYFTLPAGNAVSYLSTWLWVAPKRGTQDEIFDPKAPRPIGGDLTIGGRFRTFRQTGCALINQLNQYRLWLNGSPLSCIPGTGKPSPYAGWGETGDVWKDFHLNEGWNHLLIALDATTRPADLTFKLVVPPNAGAVTCSAETPADLEHAPLGGAPQTYLTTALLLGPFPAMRESALYVRLPGDRDPRTVVVDTAARGTTVSLNAPFIHVRGFEIRHGTQFQQRGLVALHAPGDLLEGCLVREAEWDAVRVDLAGGSQDDAPITVRGNWLISPGGLGIGGSGDTALLQADNLIRAPGRRRLVAEWNRITDNNRAGHERWWESGAIKLLCTTGAIVRQNDFIGGDGPGVWFDWENYGHRIVNNYTEGVTGFLAGVEASPGPIVIGANVAVDTRPGGVWFRSALLSWSSAQVWAINNTIDGRWNAQSAQWKDQDGADGIYLDEGGSDRGTHWGALPSRRQVVVNNLITGCDAGVMTTHDKDLVATNVQDTQRGAPSRFRNAAQQDYRLATPATELTAGTANDETATVRYDFLGRPFATGVGRAIGAYRQDQPLPPATAAVIEVELMDGTFIHLVRPQSP